LLVIVFLWWFFNPLHWWFPRHRGTRSSGTTTGWLAPAGTTTPGDLV
jgi:hypothetical protein